jgi:hypothetical protein
LRRASAQVTRLRDFTHKTGASRFVIETVTGSNIERVEKRSTQAPGLMTRVPRIPSCNHTRKSSAAVAGPAHGIS